MTQRSSSIPRAFAFLALLFLLKATDFTGSLQVLKIADVSPFVNIITIYDGATPMAPELTKAMEDMGKQRDGYIKMLFIDCNQNTKEIKEFPYCSDEIRPKLPALIYTAPVLNAKAQSTTTQAKHHSFQGQLKEKNVYEFAIPLMRAFSAKLKTQRDYDKFLKEFTGIPHILYFTDKETLSPFYKALTANFRNQFAFGHVLKGSPLAEKFSVEKYPTLILNGEQKLKIDSNLLAQIGIVNQHQQGEFNIKYNEGSHQIEDVELTGENFNSLVMEEPSHILVHVEGKDGEAHPEWSTCKKQFQKMFKYYSGTAIVSTLNVKQTPAIIYYPKSIAKKQVQKTVFSAKNSFQSIQTEISSMVEDFTVTLSSDMELQQLTSISFDQAQQVAILFHEDEIPLPYKGLSNEINLKQALDFFRMKNPDPAILQRFQIKKIPALVVMKVDDEKQKENGKDSQVKEGKKAFNLQIAQYSGKYLYDDLNSFFSALIDKKEEPAKPQAREEIKEIEKQRHFQKYCRESSCYLLLLNKSPQNEDKNAQYVKELQKNTGKVAEGVFTIDGRCHSELLASLQIQEDELPSLIFANYKYEKFTRLIGRIEEKQIKSFIDKIKSGRSPWRPYSELAFTNKDCQAEHEKIQASEMAGMSQEDTKILENIRLEEEARKARMREEEEPAQKKRKRKRRPKDEDSDL